SLLYDKLAMASEGVFDPAGYAHVQQWEEESIPVLTFDTVDETWLDGGYQVEEELEPDELSDEDMSMSEPEEASETTDEETTTPEPEEPSETTDEEQTTPEPDETPEITVSGNDIEYENNAEEQ
ncbi:MAG: hypothetical protein K2N43_00350, partial [Lachnospiraceae bacterium]|nr:hypothetical protein [Lachnospiraceae bacterium]